MYCWYVCTCNLVLFLCAAVSFVVCVYMCIQELLKLFGIPYVESPSEAEAQCAMLETLNLTHGTITDDNDVLLFGGQHVYRFMFAKNRDPQKYSAVKMEDLLGELTL